MKGDLSAFMRGLNKQKAKEIPRFFAHGMTFFVTWFVSFRCLTYQNCHHGFFPTIFFAIALVFVVEALDAALTSELVTLSFQ